MGRERVERFLNLKRSEEEIVESVEAVDMGTVPITVERSVPYVDG
jgi:hypothetical protein